MLRKQQRDTPQESARQDRSRWRSRLTNLGLLLLATTVSAVVVEGIVRAMVPVRNVGPSFTSYDPIYGKRIKPNISVARITPEFTMRLTTNSDGFRGPELPADPSGAIVFLGDSFTLGYGVSDGEEYPELLRRELHAHGDDVPVVNTGMGGTGNGRWLLLLEEEIPRFEPRAIVMQIHPNDFYDNVSEGLISLDTNGALQRHLPPPPGINRMLQVVIESIPGLANSHIVGLARQARMPSGAGSEPIDPAVLERANEYRRGLIRAALEEALDYCRARGWPVVGLFVGVSEPSASMLEEIFANYSAATIRMPDEMQRPDLYYTVDRHWNADGHVLATELLLPLLKQTLVDPTQRLP